jgi:TPR repeat protein
MQRFLAALVLLYVIAPAVRADFQAGLDACNRGDYAAALREWQPLAEKGDANAQYNVGLLYTRGQGVPEDLVKAVEWYLKAAEKGVAAAQFNLGVIYANGQGGVPQNLPEARKWLEKAASRGIAEAEDALGYFHDAGQGVTKDSAQALIWYRKAAEAGLASAQYQMGLRHDLGQGMPRDYAEAMKWYRKAAGQGYGAAQCNLGILYYNAQGAERDLAQSYAWFSLCEKAGDPRGGQLRRIVESRIPPDDLNRGRQLAAEWRASEPEVRADLHRLFIRTELQTEAKTEPKTEADREVPPPPPAASPAASSQVSSPVQSYWTGVSRIVAVGDAFGDYEQFFTVLESAALVDGSGNWVGGRTHLVQTGNVVGYGPDSRRIMDLLMRLEKEAAAAGGAVHCLIGNHEAMEVSGDLRLVSPAEFDSHGGINPTDAGQRETLASGGVYARWVTGHNAVVKIDNNLFVHTGIGPRYGDWEIDRINQSVRDELTRPGGAQGGIVADPEGPLLHTGLARGDEDRLAPFVDRLLETYGVERIVAGHAYAGPAVIPRFGGKVILVNVGLSRVFDRNGRIACLVIEEGRPYALHRGQKLELPTDSGADLLRYLRQAAALDPRPSPLEPRITTLAKSLAKN